MTARRFSWRTIMLIAVVCPALVYGGVYYYSARGEGNAPYRKELPSPTPPLQPEHVTGDCAQVLPEVGAFPEIDRLLPHPAKCIVYRATIPAGELLSAPGFSLAVTEDFPPANQPGRGKELDLADLEAAKTRLIEAGWKLEPPNRVTAPDGVPSAPFHAEFRRILPDKTRQYFKVDTGTRLKFTLTSLPAPRVDFHLPSPSTLASHSSLVREVRFPELAPFPGLTYFNFNYRGGVRYFPAPDAQQNRNNDGWWVSGWSRIYHYDPAKISPLVAGLLYKDAMREAGWLISNDMSFDVRPNSGSAGGTFLDGDRELDGSVGFAEEGVYVLLTDIGLQRKAVQMLQQWKTDCAAVIPGLEFQAGESGLSEASQAALEAFLEARRIATDERESISFELRGRADPTGNRMSNLDLATARAEAVKTWLVAHEVPPETLSISAYGDWEAGAAGEATPKRVVSVAKMGCTH